MSPETITFVALKIANYCRPDGPMEATERLVPFIRQQLEKLLELDRKSRSGERS